MCLEQCHRPSVVQNLMAEDYQRALRDKRSHVDGKDKKYLIITVAHHKTAEQFLARIALDEERQGWFKDYNEYVRNAIIRNTGRMSENFLLQSDGQSHSRVTGGITNLQGKYGLSNRGSTVARHGLEQYTQHLDQDRQDTVQAALCHSKETRDKVYRYPDYHKFVDFIETQQATETFYETHSRRQDDM